MNTLTNIIDFMDRIESNTSINLSKETTDEEVDNSTGYFLYQYESNSNLFSYLNQSSKKIEIYKNLLFIIPQERNSDYHKLDIVNEYYETKFSQIFILDTKSYKEKMNLDKYLNLSIITPNDLFDIFINLSNYFEKIKNDEDFERIELEYINRKIDYLNDPDELSACNSEHFSDVLINCWLKKSLINFPILVIGDRGVGKTWCVKHFLKNQNSKHRNINPLNIKSNNSDSKWVNPPVVYINLGNISRSTIKLNSIEENIINHVSELYEISFLGSGFNWEIWDLMLKMGNIVLLLDGFDEISKRLNKEILTYYLNDIISFSKNYQRIIIATRINQFNSYNELERYFTHNAKMKPLFYRNYNILKIKDFDQNAIDELTNKLNVNQKEFQFSSLKDLNKRTDDVTLIEEIHNLSKNPAFFNSFTNLLSVELPLIKIFEESINNAFIEFNISKNKAINYLSAIKDGKPKIIPLSARKKLNYICDISWFLFEHNYDGLTKNRFNDWIQNKDKIIEIDAFYNDIKCQTVFTSKSKDEEKFIFLTEGLKCFFIGKYLADLINAEDQKKFNEGLRIFGLYNFYGNYLKNGKEILDFVSEFLKDKTRNLLSRIKEINLKQAKYRFLVSNLKYILADAYSPEDSWFDFNNHLENKYTILNNKFVLIIPINKRENKNIDSFFIKKTEVTNNEFEHFLKDNKSGLDTSLWKRSNITKEKNKFKDILNDYHLLYWKDGRMPDGFKEHPVVYISWFAAAYYCNWLSIQEKIDTYYKFTFKNGKFIQVVKNKNSGGFRLPSNIEWDYVAREGNYSIKYPWDKYTNLKDSQSSETELTSEGINLRSKLLDNKVNSLPVMSDNPDNFGTYGTMGNVREWVDRNEKDEDEFIRTKKKMPIKGATWLLGEDGFDFDHLGEVYAENTNFDVGFRVARSLTTEESNILKKYKL